MILNVFCRCESSYNGMLGPIIIRMKKCEFLDGKIIIDVTLPMLETINVIEYEAILGIP